MQGLDSALCTLIHAPDSLDKKRGLWCLSIDLDDCVRNKLYERNG